MNDLKKHVESKKHKQQIQTASTSKSMDSFVIPKSSPLAFTVWASEATLAYHTVKHHFSFSSMDCTAPLTRILFKDSEIGQKLTCSRTKTEAIINNVLAPYSIDLIVKNLEKIPFISISTDSSNHGSQKLFPLILQYFDYEKSGIEVKLIALQETTNEKAETVKNVILEVLDKHNLRRKLSAFVGDNAKVNFGGINRGGSNNIFHLLKEEVNSELIGIGCPAHILHNTAQHGMGQLELYDVDILVFKIFRYFSIYTVRTNELKEFCEYVEVEYRPLLYHSKTRFLSLLPAVERLLMLFPALKSYFTSIDNPPKYLKDFFSNEFAEPFLLFVHSFMAVFHVKIAEVERQENSILEIQSIVDAVADSLRKRIDQNFLPFTLLSELNKLNSDGKEKECQNFKESINSVYQKALDYLLEWTSSLNELRPFNWLNFNSDPLKQIEYTQICESIAFLKERQISIDDNKIFDQLINLNSFLDMKKEKDPNFFKQSCNSQVVQFFKANANIESFSEILKIAQFFFSIPGHNANCERIFSLINVQWSEERNRLLVETVRNITMVQFNYEKMSCENFHKFVSRAENVNLLKKVGSSEKYNK